MNTRRSLALFSTAALWMMAGSAVSLAQVEAPPAPAQVPAKAVADAQLPAVAQSVWAAAKNNSIDAVLAAGKPLAGAAENTEAGRLAQAFARFEANIAKRETSRQTQMSKVRGELTAVLAKEATPLNLSEALKDAVELHELTPLAQRDMFLKSDEVRKLVQASEVKARELEGKGEWLMANELFGRLNILLEDEGRFKNDSERLVQRLSLLRLYTPQRFWELRNARQLMEEGKKPLPPFNPTGESYTSKLKDISFVAVLNAMRRAADRHVERTSLRTMLIGGFDHVRTMATTHDLDEVFPLFKDADASAKFLAFIDQRVNELRNLRNDPSNEMLTNTLRDLLRASRETVQIPDEAILHEFGNGAFAELDEFSAIVWPDELERFSRMTQGSFIGVGIQIQLDEETQLIKIVQPIEGTPAQRAGMRPGDLIKKIDEKSAVGMSLDQAIENITGKAGSTVSITIDRGGQEIKFDLQRSRIPLRTAKGYKRTGSADTDWDYFIDKQAGVGYVRLSGFNDETTKELHTAINQMRQQGELKSLILDLRFNPGGLLNQAVSVANTFIKSGTVVYTESAGGVREQTETAEPSGQIVPESVPVVVLINRGSASASEIVSGAIRHYGNLGRINGLVIGDRSFGKGSVQNVMGLTNKMQMKLTTQYYYLPGGELIHKRPGADQWGVDPHMRVEMLPKQTADAFSLRLDADTPAEGRVVRKPEPGEEPLGEPEPDRLINEGFDLQLEAAVLVLRAQSAAREAGAQANKGANPGG
jgi:carboxyl-terminal processing protease